MSDEGPPPHKRARVSREDLENMPHQELLDRWAEREAFIETLLSRPYSSATADSVPNEELSGLRESEEKLKQQQIEATRRENVLVMRLTTKEQEMQEYINQIQELKQSQNPSTSQLRNVMLDPAVNLMFQRMKREMDACKEKLEQAQNDLAAWKFTPDSQTGKRLMAKCRMLLQENEELGKTISSGRTAKLEGEIALEKTLVQEMKKSQAEMDEFLVELDEDVEGMQSTIYLLQQQLKDAKDQISCLQQENAGLRAAQKRTSRSPTPTTQTAAAPPSTALTDSHRAAEQQRTANEADNLSSVSAASSLVQHERDVSYDQRTQREPEHNSAPSRDYNKLVVSTNYNSNDRTASPAPSQTNPQHTSNGGHTAVTTETDSSDSQAESEEDKETSTHGQDRNEISSRQTLKIKSVSSNHGNHSQNMANPDHSTSDGAYGTENTDATSSDGWSPRPHPKDPEAIVADDDDGSTADSDTDERTDTKHRTEVTITGVDNSRLQNGLVDTPYDSQGDEEET